MKAGQRNLIIKQEKITEWCMIGDLITHEKGANEKPATVRGEKQTADEGANFLGWKIKRARSWNQGIKVRRSRRAQHLEKGKDIEGVRQHVKTGAKNITGPMPDADRRCLDDAGFTEKVNAFEKARKGESEVSDCNNVDHAMDGHENKKGASESKRQKRAHQVESKVQNAITTGAGLNV